MTTTAIERCLLAALVLIGLSFALFTHHVWEDFYIAFRSSKNLALGYGLVFQQGERVQSFSSPIGVLVPALLSALTANSSDQLVLWLFRVSSVLVLVGAGLTMIRGHRRLGVATAATAFTLVLLATESKIIDFSINGMESAFLVFFIVASWVCLAEGDACSVPRLALVWAGLQYARPDGFVYGVSVAAGVLLFVERGWRGRRRALWRMSRAAGLALLFYSPWLIWTWAFYGTPVPHTIVAKQLFAPPHDALSVLHGLLSFPRDLLTTAPIAFAPTYAVFGGWPSALIGTARLVGCGISIYWLVPFAHHHARALSFAFGLALFYLTHVIVPAPWYLPALAIIGIMTLGMMAQDLLRLRSALGARGATRLAQTVRWTGLGVAAGLVLFSTTTLGLSAYQLRIQQHEIESGLRMPIGLWLHDHARPGDRVFLEPLGYVGYFSGLKMLDFPGLASPEVVAARRHAGSSDWGVLIEQLTPEWLVLRAGEAERVFKRPAIARQYEVVRTFDATERLNAYRWIPGRGYLDYDRTFVVVGRRPSPGQPRPGS